MRYSAAVLSMATAVAAQEASSSSYYTKYFEDSLSFEYDLQEHDCI